MRRNIVLYFVFVLALVMGLASIADAKEYTLKISMWPQEQGSWCSVSVIQALASYLNDRCYSQKNIVDGAGTFLATKAKIGPIVGSGWNAGDVQNVLRKITGKGFDYQNHNSRSSAFDRIKKEAKEQGHPLAIAANTCYSNGVPKSPQGHWMLIEGLNLNKKGEFDGVYIKDPLYGSKFAPGHETLRPRTWVRDVFDKWWIPNKSIGKEFRQSVEY